MTKKQKTIEKKIEEQLEDIAVRFPIESLVWFLLRDKIIEDLKGLISDIIQEIVGKDIDHNLDFDIRDTPADGYNQAKQEIYDRARRLGIKI